MDEEIKKPAEGNLTNATEGGQDEIQAKIDAVVQKRLAEERKKFDKELTTKVEEARLEAERLTKLSSEEREKELTANAQKAVAEKERELSIRENKLVAYKKLTESGFDADEELVNLVISGNDMDKTIEYLKNKVSSSADKIVEKRLEGKKQEAVGEGKGKTKPLTETPAVF